MVVKKALIKLCIPKRDENYALEESDIHYSFLRREIFIVTAKSSGERTSLRNICITFLPLYRHYAVSSNANCCFIISQDIRVSSTSPYGT